MNNTSTLLFALLLSIGASVCGTAHAEYQNNNRNYGTDKLYEWKENEQVTIPDFKINKTHELDLDGRSNLAWFLAPKTISIGEDDVVRYVVFAISNSGTINAMYEGILCSEGTVKVYARAIGHEDQHPIEWRKIESPKWRNMDDLSPSAHERLLAKHYICDVSSRPNAVNDILKKIIDPYRISRGK